MNSEQYMQRCLELAALGAGQVAPNPMVGAVLVHNDRVIGEGYHQRYGEAHAEVNCIDSVTEEDKKFIAGSTLYVSLEPCAHFGKTPPCADLIIRHRIPRVVIGCRDPFPEVNGKGIEKLQAADVNVVTGILEKECRELNKRFFTFHTKQRPYISLKWAQTADKFIAAEGEARLLISNDYSNRLVHKWRSEEAAILVGTNTALKDDPLLTTRLWKGSSPVRLVIDRHGQLPATLRLFNKEVKTIVFTTHKKQAQENLLYYQLQEENNLLPQILKALYEMKILSVLVEGGASLLQSFLDQGLWDEIRVISSKEKFIGEGLAAPVFQSAEKQTEWNFLSDKIEIYKRGNE